MCIQYSVCVYVPVLWGDAWLLDKSNDPDLILFRSRHTHANNYSNCTACAYIVYTETS